MANIHKSAAELIGNTPLLEVTNIERDLGLKAKVLVKLEYFNPAGSVKDRIAKAMIEDAEAKGLLGEGSTIIEPTSGNTGIGLAAIAAAKGYRIILTMPETMSVERRNRPPSWRWRSRTALFPASSSIRPTRRSTGRPPVQRSGATPTAK